MVFSDFREPSSSVSGDWAVAEEILVDSDAVPLPMITGTNASHPTKSLAFLFLVDPAFLGLEIDSFESISEDAIFAIE